jgi:hypothetical protein
MRASETAAKFLPRTKFEAAGVFAKEDTTRIGHGFKVAEHQP